MRASEVTRHIDSSNSFVFGKDDHERETKKLWLEICKLDANNKRAVFLKENTVADPWLSAAILENTKPSILEEPPFGNPHLVEVALQVSSDIPLGVRGAPLKWMTNRSGLEYGIMASSINRYLERSDRLIITEIGGGFGGLARTLLLFFPGIIDYVSIDFEVLGIIQETYIDNALPGDLSKKFGTLLPLPEQLPGTFENLIQMTDVIINTRSMMEMDLQEVCHYLQGIQRTVRPGTLFYCLNRDKITRMHEWPFDGKWSILSDRRWPTHHQMRELVLKRL